MSHALAPTRRTACVVGGALWLAENPSRRRHFDIFLFIITVETSSALSFFSSSSPMPPSR
jgi:hypothetical protein